MRVFAGSIARGSAHLTARPPRARRATRPRATPSDASRPSDSPPDSAARVAVTCRGREVSARVGAKLRSALLLGGVSPHNDAAEVINCRGLGTCGTCAVEIIPRDAVAPDEWTVAECARLNFPPHASPGNERLRLACQVRVRGPCEVRKYARFWGQGDALAPPEKSPDPAATATTTFGPFGRLEFALDPEAFAESSREQPASSPSSSPNGELAMWNADAVSPGWSARCRSEIACNTAAESVSGLPPSPLARMPRLRA